MAFLLNVLHDLQSRFSFNLQLEWVDTKSNKLADALSRDDFDVFECEMRRLDFDTSRLQHVQVDPQKRSAWASRLMQLRPLEIGLRQAPELTTKGL